MKKLIFLQVILFNILIFCTPSKRVINLTYAEKVIQLEFEEEIIQTVRQVCDKIRICKHLDPLAIQLHYLIEATKSLEEKVFVDMLNTFINKFNNKNFKITDQRVRNALRYRLIIDNKNEIFEELRNYFVNNNITKISSITDLTNMLKIFYCPFERIPCSDFYMFFLLEFVKSLFKNPNETKLQVFQEYLKKLQNDNYEFSKESYNVLLYRRLINSDSSIPLKSYLLLTDLPKNKTNCCKKVSNLIKTLFY